MDASVEMQLGLTKFPVGKWVLDRIGHALSHCSTERPIGAGIIYHFPACATTQALEHFIYVTIKRTLCICASFLLLGFIWIAWICSLWVAWGPFLFPSDFCTSTGAPLSFYLMTKGGHSVFQEKIYSVCIHQVHAYTSLSI
jgi:hypothetical protein